MSAAENEFRIKLGRIYSPSGSKRWVRFAGQIKRAANGYGRRASSGGRTGHYARADYFSRRVIVKFSVVKMAGQGASRQAAHIDYIQRESAAKDNDKGYLFDADEDRLGGDDFKQKIADDRHQFRIIVSPEDSRHMTDLRGFTRELMGEMEATLGTKLNWVAANHYDTATPHTHIVVSGTDGYGKQVIIPRDYIKAGMRLQAERLVNMELGPVLAPEAGLKLARMVTQERFTQLDRSLLFVSDNGLVDLSKPPPKGESWSRRFDVARLKTLSRLGLAHRQGRHHWKLSAGLEPTLRRMGERGDIIKTLHKSLSRNDMNTDQLEAKIYDAGSGRQTARIIEIGVRDDVNDRAFTVVDSLEQGPVYVDMGRAENLETLSRGDVVEFEAASAAPKPSDITIAKVAQRSGGLYSYEAHRAFEPNASLKYVEAHVRRLEAMRRLGHATHRKDGSWQVPENYLDRAQTVETQKTRANPIDLRWRNRTALNRLTGQIGRTWLDAYMVQEQPKVSSKFAKEVRAAIGARRAFLFEQGILNDPGQRITQSHLSELERRDLEGAGSALEKSMGKPYKAAPAKGRIDGKLMDKIERPSGEYGIIERAKDFTLVPWRDDLEKRKGLEISGDISAGGISWRFGRKRGLDIS